MFVDTHTHFYMEQFDGDRPAALTRSLEAGVQVLLMPNVDSETIGPMMETARTWSGICLPMIGLHPTSVKPGFEAELELVEHWLERDRFVAIGETGIDLYWDKSWLKEQMDALRRQAQLALEYRLPLVLHSRKSLNEIFAVLKEFAGSGLKGVFHCFPGSEKEAEKAIEAGFFLGIGGVVTYKNSSMSHVVEAVGASHLILETDAPYLPPVPYRGQRNESAYIPVIAEKVAEILQMDLREVEAVTTKNAVELFGFSISNNKV